MNRPPLGITPKYIMELQRLETIREGIERYIKTRKQIPLEWISEYNELLQREYRNNLTTPHKQQDIKHLSNKITNKLI